MRNGSLLQAMTPDERPAASQLERLVAAHDAVSTHQKIVSTFQRAAR
jgi:hypothetical protein